MRTSEWICFAFLALFLVLGLIRTLPPRQRIRVMTLGICGMLLIWLGTIFTVLRDWIPALLMLFVYWQGGSFFSKTNEKLQAYLERFDQRLFAKLPVPVNLFWEIAYFFCYPLVPGAIATLYALNLRNQVDFFWTIVLPPTFLCHIVVSLYQTYPPWKFRDVSLPGSLRKMNFLVIQHASIQVNTFPSAHVAASVAIALAMLQIHWIAGLVFLFLAISITVSTVMGRYHYAADAVLGIFLALGWFVIINSL
ncbi:phosphatase PAP2 family protein [bacterium]|nr:phosphatase PAP2 family protein [bacterium]